MPRGSRTIGWALPFALAAAVAGAAPPWPAPPKAAAPPEDGQWRMAAKDYANTRFSGLDQIRRDNVARLKPVIQFDTGTRRGQEAAPLVVDGTLYVVTPYPNVLFALDLTKPGAPVKWKFEPKPAPAAQGVACCDVVNRGAAYAGGRLFYNTLDAHTVAVDARSGKQVWKTKLGNIHIGETMTMAPIVARDKVIVGNSGGEFGVRGWIAALDARTGRELWRAFSTGPDADVKIGPAFKPFYEMDRGKDLGVTTWPPQGWEIGGGNVWGWISYDPELNLLYHGTANPGPWNHNARPGDNKWTAGVFARDLDTGAARWFYQWSPHDLYDHDGVNENILLDGEWQGKLRKLLVHPERNGYLYVLDRTTGEVLAADPFGPITSSTGVDLKTGRLQHVKAKEPVDFKVVRNICPAAPGLKDWNPAAYSPRTGLLYIPHNTLCMDFEGIEANYIAGTPYLGAETRMYAGPGGHGGVVTAWDVLGRKARWTVKEKFPVWSGALVTAGDVVFYGTMDGWFKALDADSGRELWKHPVDSGIIGQPTTYRGPDGRQYVAIMSGVGGWSGAIVAADLDRRDATAGGGFVNAMRELPDYTKKGGTLYVFALP